MKKSITLKLEKQTIAIIRNSGNTKVANAEAGAGRLASLVEICTSLTSLTQ